MRPPNAFAWAYGEKTAAEITADATAFLNGWTWCGERWAVDTPPVVAYSTGEDMTLAGTAKEYGMIKTHVDLIIANTAMWQYVIAQKFPTDSRSEATFPDYAAATLRLWDIPAGAWVTVNFQNAIAPRRAPEVFQPKNGKLPYVRFQFWNGVIAAAGE
jgi:hypothetical protein